MTGMYDRGNKVIKRESPVNRSPKDIATDLQRHIDEKLQKLGFKALRSNSLFASADYRKTDAFGSVSYVAFPYNDSNYTIWSQSDDLYETMGDIFRERRTDYEYMAEELIKVTKPTSDINVALERMKIEYAPLLRSTADYPETMINGTCIYVENDYYFRHLSKFLMAHSSIS